MSGIVELLLAHREDPTWPDSCVCQDAIPAGGFRDGQYAKHLADAIAAHLAEVVGSPVLWDHVWMRIADIRDASPRTTDDADSGEIADAVLAVVAKALTGQEHASQPAQGANEAADVAEGHRDGGDGPKWVDLFGADPDYQCAHEWLLRPESDTHYCQICGDER